MSYALRSTEEWRGLSLADAECEIRETEGEKRFFGHAAVFNVRTAIGNPLRWGFYEQVSPGAFTKTLSEGDARFLIDHDSYYVVSRVSAGTLYLAQDSRGLAVDSALEDELSYVKDLKTNLRIQNITGMSFGFYVVKDDWDTETVETSDGNSAEVEIRTIQEVKLIEVSAVTFPAYEDTDAGLRHVKRALLRRGDADAIRRRAEFKPELRELLDQLPGGSQTGGDARADLEVSEVDGQEKLTDVDAHADVTEEASSDEPGETTRTEENCESTEPVASTRYAHREMAEVTLRMYASRLRTPAK
jgi:HK97 family phage prohead protease